MEKEFLKEIRKRNKNKFIEIVSKEIKKFQTGFVNIPEFVEAEEAYNEFQKANLFDSYGYLRG